jgi:hypothetical protein
MRSPIWPGLLVALSAAAAHADEIDVRGSWQVNLSCGGLATATSFLDLDENLATGELTELPVSSCGTVTFSGEPISTVATCAVTPDPGGGQVSGTSFVLPAGDYDDTQQTLTAPVYWNALSCLVASTAVQNRITGTIEESGGVATRIVGFLTNGSVQLLDPNGSTCISLPGPITACNVVMLRNDVPAGSNVSVAPSDSFTVTFSTVTGAGTAAVTPVNEPAAETPPAFRVLGSVLPTYYDVTTTATVSGPILSCHEYPDANDDGTVDGTNIDEDDMRLLHEEDLVFVDRTVSLDTVANVVCAETTSLSQLAPGAPTAGGGGGGGGGEFDVPVSGVKLVLKYAGATQKGAFVSRDQDAITPPAPGSADDPRTAGATFDIVSDVEGLATHALPPAGWQMTQSGTYKFLQPADGDVKKAVLKPGKAIVVKLARNTGLSLGGQHGAVSVRLTTGGIRHCARFGPDTIVKDETGRFIAKGALAASLIDCSDAALGLGSPSGAFLDGPSGLGTREDPS